MNAPLPPAYLSILAVLAGAPAASAPISAMWTSVAWACLLALSAGAAACSHRMRLTQPAGGLIGIVLCTTLAATMLLLPDLGAHIPSLPPASLLLLALTAAIAAPQALRPVLYLLLVPTLVFILSSCSRMLLPPMTPATAAALGLAWLAAVAALLQGPLSAFRPP